MATMIPAWLNGARDWVRGEIRGWRGPSEALQRVTSVLGLREREGHATGDVLGQRVEVRDEEDLRGRRIRAEVFLRDPGLALRAETRLDGLRGVDLRTGDDGFDAQVRVDGRAVAMGRLTAQVRRDWLKLAQEGIVSLSAEGRLVVVGRPDADPVQLVRRLAGIAAGLGGPRSEVRRLAKGVRDDPVADVRLRCLGALADADEEVACKLARRVVREGDIRMQVLAAVILKRCDLLMGLLTVGLPPAAEGAAAEALGRLGTSTDLVELVGLLPALPASSEEPVRRAMAAIRARHGGQAGGLALVPTVGGGLSLATALGAGRQKRIPPID